MPVVVISSFGKAVAKNAALQIFANRLTEKRLRHVVVALPVELRVFRRHRQASYSLLN